MTMRIGVGVHQSGRWGSEIAEQARRAEEAGFDSMWLGDHVISPRRIESRYPYAASGQVPWQPEHDMFESVVSATVAATVTSRIVIGFGTLVLPLRHPILLAKQLSSLDRFSRGRLVLGVGTGWSREEFDAIGANFDERFEVSSEWIELMRACWTGYPGILHGRHYDLAVDSVCFPTPLGPLPILIGGHSPEAIELVATAGDGWYPLLSLQQLSIEWLEPRWRRVCDLAVKHGRNPADLKFVVYAATGIDEVCARLPTLRALGVQEVVIGIDWDDPGSGPAAVRRLRAATSRLDEYAMFGRTEQIV